MKRKSSDTYGGRLPDDPSCNRSILGEQEWAIIKDSIDACREGDWTPDDREILASYDLWDHFNDTPDQNKINFLYMRNT